MLVAVICGLIIGGLTTLVLALDQSKNRIWTDYLKVFISSSVFSGIIIWLVMSGFFGNMGGGSIQKGGALSPKTNIDFEVSGSL